MGLVSTWLSGIGLSHAISSFQAAGIVTPAALAELDLAHYEALGVTEANDRRKLFYLVQRIRMAKDKDDHNDDTDESTDQQEVDEVLAKTLASGKTKSKLILDEDDSLGEEDEEIEPEPKPQKERRTSQQTLSVTASKRRNGNKKGMSKKENRPLNPPTKSAAAPRRSSVSGGRTAKTSLSRIEKAASRKRVTEQEEDDELDVSKDDKGDSDWEEGNSDTSDADEELPQQPRQRRLSTRLREKRGRRSSDVAFQSSSRDQGEESSDASTSSRRSTRSRSSAGSQQGIPLPTRVSSSGTASNRRRSSSSTVELSDDSSSNGQQAQTSAMPKPRSRRYESKIQNPGASARTGKQLSAIPSESIAPMSPLVSLPVSRMDDDIRRQQELEEKKAAIRSRRTSGGLTRQRSGSFGSQSGSDSEKGGGRQKRLSSSDSETSAQKRSSRRQSLGSVSNRKSGSTSTRTSKSRRSLGGVGRPNMSSHSRPQSLRDLRPSESDSEGQPGRHSLPASSRAIPADNNKGPVFIHGVAADTSWAAQVSRLREDNDAEHELFEGHCMDADDDEMRIRVIVRKRPMSSSEAASEKEIDIIHPLEYNTHGRILVYQPKTRVDLTKEVETVPFAYDNVFDDTSNNLQIYNRAVRNLIPGVFQGKFCSVFAYGATGSGKTFTMMGSNVTGINAGNATYDEKNFGLYYMAALDLFEMANERSNRDLSVGASLFEIYSGKLFDLLNERKVVKCLENHRGKVCFPGLSEHPVGSAQELMGVIEAGVRNRSTGSTSKNADSSRSHAVIQLSLRKDIGRQKDVEHGRLTFIDLAGSERGADTSQASRTTRLEGAEINTSLLALKEVIRALAKGDSMAHIPFRGSRLTQVLKESFVGKNSQSVMVACIAPNISSCEHTLNSLRYADRVKERDHETGRLPASVVNDRGRGSSRRLSRSSSAPVRSAHAEADAADTDEESLAFTEYDFEASAELPAREETRLDLSDRSTDSALLDDLLDSDEPNSQIPATTSVRANILKPLQNNKSEDVSTDDRKLAAESLVAAHRSAMAEMLTMVKHEMALVNKADGNRDVIDSYMDELDGTHEKQLSLISTLRDRLVEFNVSRGRTEVASKLAGDMCGMLSDDDSFEDLRD